MTHHPAHRRLATTRRNVARAATAVTIGAAVVCLPALPASAHVRVVPGSTTAGSYAALTFRVPNESATATTTRLVVTLPTDTPLLSVSTRPVPGWTATVEDAALPAPVDVEGTTLTRAPATVTWTAQPGSEIGDGQFQEFEITAGPLPAAGTDLLFPAAQTYSDGTVVRWDERSDGGAAPEHPAPELTVTAPSADGPTASSDGLARGLGAGGLALGVVAVGVATVGRRRAAVASEAGGPVPTTMAE